MRPLFRVGLRHLIRHPWQFGLMVAGITLGIAVVIAIDLANASARRAFDLSTQAITGKATHQITGDPRGIDESHYIKIRRSGVIDKIAPVITEYVLSEQLGSQPLQLMGVDVFAERPFRKYLEFEESGLKGYGYANLGVQSDLFSKFLTSPRAVLLSENMAKRYSLVPGQEIQLIIAGREEKVEIAGFLNPPDALTRRALDGLILADIATAQELTGKIGRLDRIDLILPEDPYLPCSRSQTGSNLPCSAAIQEFLPPNAVLQTVQARLGSVDEMTSAFRVNLSALSLLALVVGMFLIYNTMTFSVIQRRQMFGTLRCLGVTRREIFFLVMSEALLVGILCALTGTLLGLLLGQGAVRLVTQTINDLYFVVTVRGIQIPTESVVKGVSLGILATLLSTAPPAWEAASIPPRQALSRSGLEGKALRAIDYAARAGLFLILVGIAVLFYPTRDLVISFTGTFAVIIGCALLTPIATKYVLIYSQPVLGRIWGILGRVAPRNVIGSLSRTAIAVMALMVAISVTIGVRIMVSSFRSTVVTWLSETLQGDIYISAPNFSATTPSTAIDPSVLPALTSWPGVDRLYELRAVAIESPYGPLHANATSNTNIAFERVFLSTEIPPALIWAKMEEGAVLVSEPLFNRLNLPRDGGIIPVYTAQGPLNLPVIGVFYDYANSQGTVLMSLEWYRSHWNDLATTAINLRLLPNSNSDDVVRQLQDNLHSSQSLIIRSNQALRAEVLSIFDRTFAITGALQLLAIIVAFIGILSALLSLELERQREIGILRSLGLTVRQLWKLILLETGLLGAVAGLFAMPTGYLLAYILVYVINRRSFGWTLQIEVEIVPFITALLLSVTAALLAGVYPSWRMGKMVTTEALRSE